MLRLTTLPSEYASDMGECYEAQRGATQLRLYCAASLPSCNAHVFDEEVPLREEREGCVLIVTSRFEYWVIVAWRMSNENIERYNFFYTIKVR